MISNDDPDMNFPANLRDAADDPSRWDVPGLMRDAADRIELLESTGPTIGQEFERTEKMKAEFGKHAEAAEALYAEIYRLAVIATGKPAAQACGPLGAVRMIVEEFLSTRKAIEPFARIASKIPHDWPEQRTLSDIDSPPGTGRYTLSYHKESNGCLPTIGQWRSLIEATPPSPA